MIGFASLLLLAATPPTARPKTAAVVDRAAEPAAGPVDAYAENYVAVDLSDHDDPVERLPGPAKLQGSSGDADSDIRFWWERGFRLIGSAQFYGPRANQRQALAFADKLGARYVIQPPRYRIDFRETAPANAGYQLGPCDVWQRATVPDAARPPVINPYDNLALFFAAAGRERSGLLGDVIRLDPAVHPGFDHGLRVLAVRQGSPGEGAGFAPGDLIMAVDGVPLTRDRPFTKAQREGYGRAMPVTVFRDAVITLTLTQAADGRW